jgi:hypothetical protein
MATEIIFDETVAIDRLALSRAQHLKSRDHRPKSISDDEPDAISDWSESDRECCPLSDFESTSNVDGTTSNHHHYDIPFEDDEIDDRLPRETTLLDNILSLNETPLPIISDSATSTRMSFSSDIEKFKQQHIEEQTVNVIIKKPPIQVRKQSQPALLPGRRVQSKEISPRRLTITTNSQILSQSSNLSRNRKIIKPNPSKFYLRHETTSTHPNFNISLIKESTLSSNSSFHSNEDNSNQQRHIASPNLSQTSTINGVIPRVYEVKKLYVDDCDYGRLTDVSTVKTIPARNRQKWGTIVHPPFPLGYQQIPPEQVTQAVERLTSPVRCRDRHTPVPTPSKRYLSVEETDALVKTKKISFLNDFIVFSFR